MGKLAFTDAWYLPIAQGTSSLASSKVFFSIFFIFYFLIRFSPWFLTEGYPLVAWIAFLPKAFFCSTSVEPFYLLKGVARQYGRALKRHQCSWEGLHSQKHSCHFSIRCSAPTPVKSFFFQYFSYSNSSSHQIPPLELMGINVKKKKSVLSGLSVCP